MTLWKNLSDIPIFTLNISGHFQNLLVAQRVKQHFLKHKLVTYTQKIVTLYMSGKKQ